MLRIGDFSRLTGVSIKALRHYDDIGLLRPALVDGDTSYRRYSSSQIAHAQRIAALKELGFALREIAEIIRGGDVCALLRSKRSEVMRDIHASRDRLGRIDALLADDAASIDVAIRRTPARAGLSMRTVVATYAEADEWLAETMTRLPAPLRNVERGALWHACDPAARRIDCEVVYFAAADPPRGFQRVVLPESNAATILYSGDWLNAYTALDRALIANRWTMSGSKLERFMSDDVVELSVPVRNAS